MGLSEWIIFDKFGVLLKGEIMENKNTYTYKYVTSGVSFGCALAICISWSLHKSILWAMLHGFFSWFYVIYYAMTR